MAVKTYQKGSKEKLSKNFKVSEFACNGKGCCTIVMIDEQLMKYLQQIRDHFGKPITITSAYRCATHNKKVGGATGSRHTKGQAADFGIAGVKPAEIAKYAESIGVKGIGLYETAKDGYFVHIDTREKKSFWYGKGQAYRATFGGAAPAEDETAEKTCTVKLPILSKGSKGEYVETLQRLLIARGYDLGKSGRKKDGVDGDYGNATAKAVRAYQTATGKTVDEIAGAQVWSGLLSGK